MKIKLLDMIIGGISFGFLAFYAGAFAQQCKIDKKRKEENRGYYIELLTEVRKTFVSELEKCKGRAFTHESWTEEKYREYEETLEKRIKEIDDKISEMKNHGA